MRKTTIYILGVLILAVPSGAIAIDAGQVQALMGQDLHLEGPGVTSYRLASGEHILVFADGLTMGVGANAFRSGPSVVWLERMDAEFAENGRSPYIARAYMTGGVSISEGTSALTTDIRKLATRDGLGMVVWFTVSGSVVISADSREVSDPHGDAFYTGAVIALWDAGIGNGIVRAAKLPAPKPPQRPATPVVKEPGKPGFRYPINISPAGEAAPKLEASKTPGVATLINRFYLWQKQDEEGGLLELQADHAVVFFWGEDANAVQDTAAAQSLLATGKVKGIYLSGDVLMTSGQRTIRAEELYYDFDQTKAIVKHAEMRNFDETQGIPIYIRARELRQVAADKFTGKDVTVTTDEFHTHQMELKVAEINITDTTTVDAQQGEKTRSSYDADMKDVDLNVYGATILHLPKLRSNLERPDTPLKGVHVGHGSRWGNYVETRWYLARLLGLEEPEGTESTLGLDYYSKRGVGGGIEVDYQQENYFGQVIGYIINDHGKDRLARHRSRRGLVPPRDLRGRFLWRHRQFLANNWQLTGEISYISDRNFLESFYRSDFNLDKEQETLLHLKRIQDNWSLAFLTKVRINDWASQLEELPTGEFHWTGQSFFNDRLTFYSDTQVSRLRQRYSPMVAMPGPGDFFTFMTTRNEVDMPFQAGKFKIVPFVAGTAAYEDGMGFFRNIDGTTGAREDDVYYGEAGVRVSRQPWWRVYPDAKSRMWDLDQLRHVVQPHMTAVAYGQDDSVIEQRDMFNVGLTQRLQTKRGVGDQRRTVDWMRLNTEMTWVDDPGGASAGADQFIWNTPFTPLINTTSAVLPQMDRRSSSVYGLRRDTFAADYQWRVTDTTAVLSDINYDVRSGVVQQYNVGFSHMRWPNLSYYVGSRYLRRIMVFDPTTGAKLQEGSNAFIFAITYVLDPRYTVVFSQQIDFDYGATVGSELSLIRRYHRMYWGLTFKTDESLDEQGIVFSIWPQGVPELSLGQRRYMRLGDSSGY